MLRPRIPRTAGQLSGHEPVTSYLVKGFSHGTASYEAVHEAVKGSAAGVPRCSAPRSDLRREAALHQSRQRRDLGTPAADPVTAPWTPSVPWM